MAAQQISTSRQVVSWAAVSAIGVVGTTDLGVCYSKFSLQTVVTGAPASVSVTLQGSLDGVNFTTLATSSSTTGDLQSVADKPVRFVRADVGTLTGGAAPTVTAFVGVVS